MLGIITLNWNKWEDTIETLNSIYNNEYDDFFILLIDNGSKNESCKNILSWLSSKKIPHKTYLLKNLALVKEIEVSKKETLLICSPNNYGYAGGNNIGIYVLKRKIHPKPEYVLFLNNDIFVLKDTIGKLIKIVNRFKGIDVITPTILYYKTPLKIQHLYGFIDWFGLNMPLNIIRYRKNFKKIPTEKGSLFKSERILGAAFLIKYDVLEKVGYFNPDFYLQVEDTDLSLRIIKKGYRIYGYDNAFVLHKTSVSLNEVLDIKIAYLIRNRFLFRIYYAPVRILFIFSLWWIFVEVPTLIIWNYKKFRNKNVFKGLSKGISSIIKKFEKI